MVTDTGSVIAIATEMTLSRIQREASRVVVQVSVSSVCAVHTQRASAVPKKVTNITRQIKILPPMFPETTAVCLSLVRLATALIREQNKI